MSNLGEETEKLLQQAMKRVEGRESDKAIIFAIQALVFEIAEIKVWIKNLRDAVARQKR